MQMKNIRRRYRKSNIALQISMRDGQKDRGSSIVEHLIHRIDLAYNEEIMVILLQSRFKIPQVELNNGSRDPIYYIENFKAYMIIHNFVEPSS